MNPVAIADVGNSRIKWGRCSPAGLTDFAALPADAPDAWQRQYDAWRLPAGPWAVAGVHPQRLRHLVAWLEQRPGTSVLVLDHWRQLPLQVQVDHPDRVGLDRLLGAVAANSVTRGRTAAVVVDAGTAITANAIDRAGVFRGGAILPGLRLMACALHEYTALLPLVEPPAGPPPDGPGTSSVAAMTAGIYWAAAGGVRALVERWQAAGLFAPPLEVFLTGGDAARLAPALDPGWRLWPGMTLEGIRLAAEALP